MPRRAHGVRFEGYWRFTDAGDRTRRDRALRRLPRRGRGTWAVVALAAHPGGFVCCAVWSPRRPPTRAGSASRPGDVLGRGSASALRVDLGPDARLDVALQGGRGCGRTRGLRGHRRAADRPRAAAVLAPAPARRAGRRARARLGEATVDALRRARPTRRRTGGRPSPSTGGGARRRAFRRRPCRALARGSCPQRCRGSFRPASWPAW